MPDAAYWHGRRVFLTGHTGFKGCWLLAWLESMGAVVTGYALPAEPGSLYLRAGFGDVEQTHHIGDVRDQAQLERAIAEAAPEVVFHLAAQALVRSGYDDPVRTFGTNVMGTVHLLDAVRRTPSVKAVVVVTTDKCYENREWDWGYRESDRLGGRDPYSNSKACAELATASMCSSFFPDGSTSAAVATARAGNVIGGGDVSLDRLVPDVLRALSAGEAVSLRHPNAVRPWLNVLDALCGYLLLAERLHLGGHAWAGAWNFGPDMSQDFTVEQVVVGLIDSLGAGSYRVEASTDGKHEARLLKLDSTLARQRLGWRPVWTVEASLAAIAEWHGVAQDHEAVGAYLQRQVTRMGEG